MPGSVLTPLDGSRFGELALPFAAAIADRTRWSLHLLHVHIPDPRNRRLALPAPRTVAEDPVHPVEEHLQARRAYLDGAARRFGLQVGSSSALLAEDEGVAGAIRRYAEESGIELIVMSTHGRTGVDRLWLGSVTDALVRATDVPVLLVRPGDGERTPCRLGDVERVLVPLDATPVGEHILEPVMKLGAALGWRFVLLHVVPTQVLFGARSYPLQAGDVIERRRKGVEYVRGVASRFREQGLSVEARIVNEEAPARAILRTAESGKIDLVAMASHGRGGLTRAILGSVADRVISGTALPVLLGGGGSTVH